MSFLDPAIAVTLIDVAEDGSEDDGLPTRPARPH